MPNNPRGSDALSQPWSYMYTARMVVLSLAAIWGGVAGGLALNAIIKLNRSINNAKSFIADHSTDESASVDVDIRNVYVPGVLSCTAAFCISAFALASFGYMLCLIKKKGRITPDLVVSQAVFMALFSFWMFVTLTAETVYFASARPSIAITGNATVTFSGTVVLNPYRHFHNVRTGIILLWFCWLFACICSATLFVAASNGPREERVYTSAQINELAERQRNDPNIEHLRRSPDPDEGEKKRSSATPQRAHPSITSPIVEPSPMSEKPTEIASTSGTGNAV